jgi:hypothetical protein
MEHAKRLAQLNKDKAKALREALVVKEPELAVVPEDKELVRIKPKRIYKPRAPKKAEAEPKNEIMVTPAPSETESEAEVSFKPPRGVRSKPKTIQPYSEPEPETEEEAPPPRRARKPAKPKRVPIQYAYETEPTTTEAESESESDDDYKIQKYSAKAEKRMNALRKIDSRLQQLNTNPYQSRNISIF